MKPENVNEETSVQTAQTKPATAISWTTIRVTGIIQAICGLAFKWDSIAIIGTTLLGVSAAAELIKDKWGKP